MTKKNPKSICITFYAARHERRLNEKSNWKDFCCAFRFIRSIRARTQTTFNSYCRNFISAASKNPNRRNHNSRTHNSSVGNSSQGECERALASSRLINSNAKCSCEEMISARIFLVRFHWRLLFQRCPCVVPQNGGPHSLPNRRLD